MKWRNVRLFFTLLSLSAILISFVVSGFWVIRAYTIQSNILVAIWLLIAYYYKDLETTDERMLRYKGWIRTGITMYITVTFVVFVSLLQAIYHPTGWSIYTNIVNHYITPIFFIFDWGKYEREPLEYKHIWYWLAYPIFYLLLTLLFGVIDHTYIYPFLDLNTQTPTEFTIWVFILLSIFVSFGATYVVLRKKYLR